MNQLFTLEEAKADYEKLKIELDEAERDLALAIKACQETHQDHDRAWYDYVRYANPKNYERFESALDALHHAHERYNESKLNYKLIRCRFKKASKLYAKLQKKAEKQNKQFGEE